MTYEEIVAKVKKAYAKADTALVDEHLAVQVDVTGEGEGAFYIEVSEGKITVEPFEYYDHDFKVLCSAEEIIDIASGKKKLSEEVELGNAYVSRNVEKVAVFDLIVAKKSNAGRKKAAEKTETAEKKTVKKVKKETEVKADTTEAKAKKKPGPKPGKKAQLAAEAAKAAEKAAAAPEKAAEEVKAVADVVEAAAPAAEAPKKKGGRKKKEA